ncbi:hypothetical protein AGMMS49960_11200 [Betaproteobacteria bacterium]|nr:hypothetical protein AGMMS49543_08910 [Betaproteobacteria bacterium]GHU01282.1 hypothetical protein AGMMS49960_11200 [Betaproteobacteria bacterium]GHU17251.1 hypothetical protein AGMMS50243_05150 [Betaproteobacteria bacterium]
MPPWLTGSKRTPPLKLPKPSLPANQPPFPRPGESKPCKDPAPAGVEDSRPVEGRLSWAGVDKLEPKSVPVNNLVKPDTVEPDTVEMLLEMLSVPDYPKPFLLDLQTAPAVGVGVKNGCLVLSDV